MSIDEDIYELPRIVGECETIFNLQSWTTGFNQP